MLPEDYNVPNFREELKGAIDLGAFLDVCNKQLTVVSELMSDEFLHFNNPEKYIELCDYRDTVEGFLKLLKLS